MSARDMKSFVLAAVVLMMVALGIPRSAAAQAPSVGVYPLAGSGVESWGTAPSAAGFAATSTQMHVFDVAVAIDESLLVADYNGAVRRVGLNGLVTDVAGGRSGPLDPNVSPALRADLYGVKAVAALPDGGFLISHEVSLIQSQPRVDRVWPDGRVTTAARLSADDLLPLPDGGFLAVESVERVVRRVLADGGVSAFAGTGQFGFSGDGGPAIRARLSSPGGTALLRDGSVLIADEDNDRIRRVDPGGRISTVARLAEPTDVAVTPDGGYVIAALKALYQVAPGGTKKILLDTRRRDFAGRRLYPRDVEVLPDGNLAVTSNEVPGTSNSRAWLVTSGPAQRLVTVIRDLSVTRKSVTVTIANTAPGTAVLLVLDGRGRPVEQVSAPVPAGASELVLSGPFDSRRQAVRVTVSDENGRIASDRIKAFLGTKLPFNGVISVLEDYVSDPGDGGPGWRRCHRFRARRVDCAYLWHLRNPRVCEAVYSVTLSRTGIPTVRKYGCRKRGEPFKRRPRHTAPATPLLGADASSTERLHRGVRRVSRTSPRP